MMRRIDELHTKSPAHALECAPRFSSKHSRATVTLVCDRDAGAEEEKVQLSHSESRPSPAIHRSGIFEQGAIGSYGGTLVKAIQGGSTLPSSTKTSLTCNNPPSSTVTIAMLEP
jgi:hypothetical protein